MFGFNKSLKNRFRILSAVLASMMIFVVAALFVFSSSISRYSGEISGDLILEGEKEKLQVSTDALAESISQSLQAVQPQTRQDTLALFDALIKDTRFEEDSSGYFSISRNTAIQAHPIKPELIDQDLHNAKDAEGNYYMRRLDSAADAGGGFARYVWPKPVKGTSTEVETPKLAYAKTIGSTEYYVSTGVYIDNVERTRTVVAGRIQEKSNTFAYVLIAVLLGITGVLVIPVTIRTIRSILRPVHDIAQASHKLALGDVSINLSIDGEDELNAMKRSFQKLVQTQKEKMETARFIAHRDLTREAASASDRDELGHALGDMRTSLVEIISKIAGISRALDTGAQQLSDASQDLSSSSTEQAAAIEEITSTMGEIKNQTDGIAESAKAIHAKIQEENSAIERGVDIITTMVDTMEEIAASGSEIGKVAKVIDDISFQTNLLALNASVEAARAGKYGKGFAVVAEEVRTLANRSAKSAGEVTDQIQTSSERIAAGQEISRESLEILKDIRKMAEDVGTHAASTDRESTDQQNAITEINTALEQIEEGISDITANSEEAAATSETLNSEAQELEKIVQQFHLPQTAASPNDEKPADQHNPVAGHLPYES
ncbi:MAG: methyl-accepting chemotaxis protein [Fibrobacterota bacterium]